MLSFVSVGKIHNTLLLLLFGGDTIQLKINLKNSHIKHILASLKKKAMLTFVSMRKIQNTLLLLLF